MKADKEAGLLRIFKKMWTDRTPVEVAEVDQMMWLDDSHSMGVIPKQKHIMGMVSSLSKGIDPIAPIKLQYTNETMEPCRVELSASLLKTALQLATKTEANNIELWVKNDYPITLKTPEMDIIIAPKTKDWPTPELASVEEALEQLYLAINEKRAKSQLPVSTTLHKIRDVVMAELI